MRDLEARIKAIENRNTKVALDKAWETSLARKLLITILTYITIVLFFYAAKLPKPFVNSIIPSIAFLISTLSLEFFKKWWLKLKNLKVNKGG